MTREDEYTRLELYLPACRENFRYFKSKLEASTKLLVLVKANAYGHGAVEFASIMQQEGADYLAVASPLEGIELRRSGISLPILVLTARTDFFPEIINYHLEPGIPNLETLVLFKEELDNQGIKDYPIHLKMDTGMHRLGFMEDELTDLEAFLRNNSSVRVKSIYSHLAAAEMPSEDEFTIGQISLFARLADNLEQSLGYRPMRHILNSAGIERFPQYQFDMVRLGIGVYGVSAIEGVRLSPVARLRCKIIQIKHLSTATETVGYDRRGHIPESGATIATIPLGYADGIDRHLGRGRGLFCLNGVKVPTIGNICMDMCMLDISGTNAKVGDTVTIFGEDPTIEELAATLDTIPYEILTSIPRRIDRVIVRR